jgi:hypothetical protein
MIGCWLNRLTDLFAPKVVSRPLLNRSEQRLHAALSIALAELNRGDLFLMTQVSYGEFLASKHRSTFLSFNSKRADFVVTDRDFNPVLVIEYQGSGHWGANWISRRNANHRDAIKRKVLRRAGIQLLEICDGFSLKQVREELGAVFGGPTSASAPNVGGGSSTQNSSTPPARPLN